MAMAHVDTTLPRAPDEPDVEMSNPTETIRKKKDLQDTVPEVSERKVIDTVAIATAASRSQKSSSKISSFSYQSETSTIAHEQTPFIDFKLQVLKLCHLLWPPAPKRPLSKQSPRPSGNRFSGLLKSRKLGRLKPSSPATPDETFKYLSKKFIVERMNGGTFNRVIGITVIDPNAGRPEQLILRVPRIAWMSRPDREVATLRYV